MSTSLGAAAVFGGASLVFATSRLCLRLLLQAGDIGLHNSPHCFPENRHALARATRVIDASISQPN